MKYYVVVYNFALAGYGPPEAVFTSLDEAKEHTEAKNIAFPWHMLPTEWHKHENHWFMYKPSGDAYRGYMIVEINS